MGSSPGKWRVIKICRRQVIEHRHSAVLLSVVLFDFKWADDLEGLFTDSVPSANCWTNWWLNFIWSCRWEINETPYPSEGMWRPPFCWGMHFAYMVWISWAADLCKSAQIYSEWLAFLWWNISILIGVVSPSVAGPPALGNRESLNGFQRWFTVTRFQSCRILMR